MPEDTHRQDRFQDLAQRQNPAGHPEAQILRIGKSAIPADHVVHLDMKEANSVAYGPGQDGQVVWCLTYRNAQGRYIGTGGVTSSERAAHIRKTVLEACEGRFERIGGEHGCRAGQEFYLRDDIRAQDGTMPPCTVMPATNHEIRLSFGPAKGRHHIIIPVREDPVRGFSANRQTLMTRLQELGAKEVDPAPVAQADTLEAVR